MTNKHETPKVSVYHSLPNSEEPRRLCNNIEMYSSDRGLWLKNIKTGAIRQLRVFKTIFGFKEKDYDWEAIKKLDHNRCAFEGRIRYGGISRWDDFKEGYCAFSWTLHPEGRYYADSDGFGGDDDDEVKIAVILNEDLEVVVPWQPMDVSTELKKLRCQE